jgi:hypothetical protein
MSEVLDRQAVYDTMRADSAPATACKGDLAVAIRRHRRRHDRMGGATRDRLLRRDSVGDQVDVDFGDLLDGGPAYPGRQGRVAAIVGGPDDNSGRAAWVFTRSGNV